MTKTAYFNSIPKEQIVKESNANLNNTQLKRLNENLRKENANLKKALSSNLASKNELTVAIKNCIMEVLLSLLRSKETFTLRSTIQKRKKILGCLIYTKLMKRFMLMNSQKKIEDI